MAASDSLCGTILSNKTLKAPDVPLDLRLPISSHYASVTKAQGTPVRSMGPVVVGATDCEC